MMMMKIFSMAGEMVTKDHEQWHIHRFCEYDIGVCGNITQVNYVALRFGHAMAQAVSLRPLTVEARSVYLEFVVDIVALG
jgi:hypothetical protein